MASGHEWSSYLARLIFSLMLILAWSGGARAGDPPAGHSSSGGQADSGNPQAAAERVSRCFAVIESLQRDIPRETFDFSAIVEKTGNEPAALLGWVRQQTRWTPYVGSLRGPLGVLMDREGNDLDRAMLLAELLRTAGRTVRLARADRTDAQVKQLLQAQMARSVPSSATRPQDLQRQVDASIDKYLGPQGLATPEAKHRAAGLLIQSERTSEDIVDRTTKQSALLEKWIGPQATGGSTGQTASEVQAADALRAHWWVQYQEAGKWHDLDISPASATDMLSPTQHIDWQPRDGHWPIDASQRHDIELRLVIEKWRDGKLSEQTVLRQTLTPSELIGQYISLSHVPQPWPRDLNLFGESDPAGKIKSLALAEHEWLPLLRIGSQAIYEGSFTDTGSVTPQATLDAFGKAGKSVAGAAADLFGSAPSAPVDHGILTAEWIAYVVRSPGRPPVEIRRQLFDLVGPAARASKGAVARPKLDDSVRLNRALALMGGTKILPLVCQLSPEYVNELTAQRAMALRDSMVEVYGAADAAKVKQIADRAAHLAPVPGRLYDLALTRGLLGSHQNETCLQELNILSSHQFLRADSQGNLKYAGAIDIVYDPIGVRPSVSADRARAVRLAQGVLDTSAEALLMEENGRAASASDLLSARAEKDQWLVVRRSDEPTWKQADISPDLRARVEDQLARGYVIVLPRNIPAGEDASAAVWWRIDPQTGQALGMSGRGWGQTMVEYALTTAIFFDACLVGGIVATHGDPGKANKTFVICALAAVSFTAVAAAGATAFTFKLVIGAAAGGGAVGGAL